MKTTEMNGWRVYISKARYTSVIVFACLTRKEEPGGNKPQGRNFFLKQNYKGTDNT